MSDQSKNQDQEGSEKKKQKKPAQPVIGVLSDPAILQKNGILVRISVKVVQEGLVFTRTSVRVFKGTRQIASLALDANGEAIFEGTEPLDQAGETIEFVFRLSAPYAAEERISVALPKKEESQPPVMIQAGCPRCGSSAWNNGKCSVCGFPRRKKSIF